MEFAHKKKKNSTHEATIEEEEEQEKDEDVGNYMLRVNWLYRPKDISKHVSDSRLLYATMHSDVIPIQGIRGKCSVKLRDHIKDLDEYRSQPDSFWFDKLYDRYILRFYEVVPTEKITNIPKKMYDILTSRFKYAIVEIGRGKDLCDTPKNCEKCSQWCSPDDSVQCAHCNGYYHMLCLDPPLTRKPTRGFGWSCAKCSGALERKLEENKGILTNRISLDAMMSAVGTVKPESNPASVNAAATATATTSPSRSPSSQPLSRYEELEVALSSEHVKKKLTKEQEHQLKLWPFRYLGVHSKMEDILDTDDRIYPRASSRLGSKHQATILDWPGRPVIYYEPEKVEKKSKKGSKTKSKTESTTPVEETPSGITTTGSVTPTLFIPKKDRPPWMQEKFPGYIERGGDTTSSLSWKMPSDLPEAEAEAKVDEYLEKTHSFAEALSIAHHSPNFVDACLQAYLDSNYNDSEALQTVATFTRKSLKEPTFTPQEKKRFEDAVRKYGSELYPVYKDVKTKTSADVVRYYYLWKKTPSGHEIWDNYEGRTGNKKKLSLQTTDDGLVDEVADAVDDSAYNNDKIKKFNREMCCKFCSTTTSQSWRRAPGYPVASAENPIIALCIRCARLWKKYAVHWENPEEVMKRVTQKSGNGTKRKIEEELLDDARSILNERERELNGRKKIKLDKPKEKEKVVPTSQSATPTPTAKKRVRKSEDAKPSKLKAESSSVSRNSTPTEELTEDVAETSDNNNDSNDDADSADKEKEFKFVKVKTPKEFTDAPTSSLLSRRCAVCSKIDPVVEQLFCQSCALNVHHHCYGLEKTAPNPNKPQSNWMCDPCSNDQKPFISTVYGCLLCPVRDVTFYNTDSPTITDPTIAAPDTIKRTFDNNWAHIRCSVFLPEVKFGNTKTLQPIDNIHKVADERFKQVCVLCGTTNGACMTCSLCPTTFHVGCAFKNHFRFGFTLQSSKGKNKGKTVKFNDSTGVMVAVVNCQEHYYSSSKIIGISEVDTSTGKTALEIYCQNYKSTNDEFTGAMKRACLYSIDHRKDNLTPPPELEASSSSTSSSLSSSSSNLALVLSPFRDLYNSEFPANQVKCEHCGYSEAKYWIETRNEESKKISIDCPPCYWKKKNVEAFKKAFDVEKISVVGNDSAMEVDDVPELETVH